MSTYSNKENIMNLSKERPALTPIKNEKPIFGLQQHGVNSTSNTSNKSTMGQIVGDNKRKIKDLEDQLKEKVAIIDELTLKTELLEDFQSKVYTKLTNNRIRTIQELRSKNTELLEKVNQYELVIQQNQESQERISRKLNNNRIRTIQNLTLENKEQKDEIARLQLEVQKLKQQHPVHNHNHNHHSHHTTIISNTSQPTPVVNDVNLNYHQSQMNRSLQFSSNYGLQDHEHVGEC